MTSQIPNGGTADLGTIRNKELKEIVLIARDAGWKVWRTRTGHLRFRPPAGSPSPRVTGDHQDHRAGGRTCTHGTSGSDTNGLLNLRKDLEREGLEFPKE